ncbi:MAG: PAS domain-containing protein, partial [Thiotrichaceae bacterium]|nr:PAS domain-containing protein [Thiotrichaceae bacterium]
MQSRARKAGDLGKRYSPSPELIMGSDPWSPLQLYSVYRLILAGILLTLGFTESASLQLGTYDSWVFTTATNGYLGIAVLGIFLTHFRSPGFSKQLYFHAITDIAFLLAVVYSSGGLNSGLGILLLLPVILPSILRPGQGSLLIAAMTVIALLTIEAYMQTQSKNNSFEMFHTGVLSFFIMVISWLAGSWFENASKTAELAKSRGIDLANLSHLNQSILDQLQTGIVVLDQNGKLRHLNPTAWDMLGQPEDWRNETLKAFAPELNSHLRYWLDKVSPKVASYDIKHWRTTEFTMRLSQLGVKNQGVVLMYLEDTRQQREKQQDVKMASLGQLTANIAHEIRNPLGAISHAAQLLSESDLLDKADERMIQIIQSNSKRMNGTIESVLNLSRKSNPKRENIRLKLWLNDFINDFTVQSSLDKKQINLFMDVADATIQFDPTHLHQVLWNLCRNAEKYAKDDVSKLHIDIQGSHPSHTRDVMLNIIDNGKGVPEENIERLFEPFFTTSTKGDEGTGLGLFMARELCLSNGCTLEYIKLPSGGSCFRLI